MNTAASLWENAQPALLQTMTEVSYKTWVLPLSPVCINADNMEFVLLCADDMARKTLESFYGAAICSCLNNANNTSFSLRFILPEERDLYAPPELTDELDRDSSFILNPRYTFDNFVIGSSNSLARAASKAVADSPSSAYNPLFIYGGVGLGKTHLMHAVGNRIMEKHPRMKIVYVTSETFTYELIESIGSNSMPAFRDKYRTADVLMVDDIQFIEGKVQTQEEFFNTFNTLHMAGKQIILNSDRKPGDLQRLEERIRSRFEGGLIADIQPPDLEMRIAILKMKAAHENVHLSDPVCMLIAEKVSSNIRQLEGSFNRILAYSQFTKKNIDVEMADSVLKGIIPGYETRQITVQDIQKTVADYYGVEIAALLSQRRTMDITFPRQVAMYLCKKMMDISLNTIGQNFGNRDHTTVMNACTKIEKVMREDASLVETIKDLEKRVRAIQ